MLITKEKWMLTTSDRKLITSSNDEVILNIEFKANTDNFNSSLVYGKTKDDNGQLISGVQLVLFSIDYNIISQTISNFNGEFYFENLPINQYYMLYGVETKKNLASSELFKLIPSKIFEANLIMKDNISFNLGIIAGKLLDSNNNLRKNLQLKLFSVDANNIERLISLTYTNDYGQFIFHDLVQGSYKIRMNIDGNESVINASIILQGQIVMV